MALNIIQHSFPENQYVKKETKKCQIVLHHTVSGAGVDGDINTWLGDNSRIATHYIIERNGTIHQCFDDKYSGKHLGVKTDMFHQNGIDLIYRKRLDGVMYAANNELLDEQSIGIEIDSFGGLVKHGDVYMTAYNKPIGLGYLIQEYPSQFRGYNAFEKYTEAALKSLESLLVMLTDKHNINRQYYDTIWSVNKKALSGVGGIFTHASYRIDKSDCHPQPSLIDMLRRLSTKL